MESCKIPHKVGQQKHQTDNTTERRELQACLIKDYKTATVWPNPADDQFRLRTLLTIRKPNAGWSISNNSLTNLKTEIQ
jgi:hypothetical protein